MGLDAEQVAAFIQFCVLPAFVVSASYAILHLTALWAAWAARPHWSIRVLILGLPIAALLALKPDRDNSRFLLIGECAVSALSVLLIASVARYARQWRQGVKIHLRDLMLVTALVGALVAGGRRLVAHPQFDASTFFLVLPSCFAATTLITSWVVTTLQDRWRLQAAILAAAAAVVISPLPFLAPSGLTDALVFFDHWGPHVVAVLLHGIISFTALRLWHLSLAPEGETEGRRRVAPRTARWLLGGLLSALIVPVVLVYGVLIRPMPVAKQIIPSPNGHALLIAAADSIDEGDRKIHFVEDPTVDALRTYVNRNAAALDLVAAASETPACVDTSYTENADYLERHMAECESVRKAELALIYRAALAVKENRADDAIRDYLLMIAAADCFRSGGVLRHWSESWSLSETALEGIVENAPKASPLIVRETIARLEQSYRTREPIQGFIARNKRFMDAEFGWFANRWADLFDLSGVYGTTAAVERWEIQHQAHFQVALLDLALLQHRRDHGRLPKRLDELVPGYLSQPPQHPAPDGMLEYRRTANGYSIRSGDNGDDDWPSIERTLP